MKIKYDSYRLDNGLKVIIHENHNTGKAAVDIVYNVGSRNENENRTGMAHLFEHLMFGGSKNIPDYDKHVEKAGGENNAFTSSDITNYYLSLPANQLETAFWLESDRMLELAFTPKSLEVQRSVVCEEFKQNYLNQPYGDAYLHLRPLHFQTHPYKWMTIGKELAHIENVSLDEVKDFFYKHYAPNNATLVVAGGVKKDEVLKLAEKWFGGIPERKLPEGYAIEPKQTQARSKTLHRPVPYSAVYKVYHSPPRADDEYYAMDLTTDILSNGKSSRLFQHMVKDTQVASSIEAYSWGLYDSSMISIEGRIAKGHTVEDYEAELEKVLSQLNNINEAEVNRMKNKVESVDAFHKTTIENVAMELAIYDSYGQTDLVNTITDKYNQLSVDQVRETATKYIKPENCSTLYYLSEEKN